MYSRIMSAPPETHHQKPEPRRRMSPDNRRAAIIRESIGFFATHGFNVDTRSLAKHMQITQALLYKYFPSKQLLVEAVFEQIFQKQGTVNWLPLLRDRSTDLKTRLQRFFVGYAASTYDYDWIRIYTLAAFAGGDLNRKYIRNVTRPLLRLIAEEVRLAAGLPLADASEVSELEIEILWVFHFGIYYHPYRTHVYGTPPPVPLAEIVEASVDGLIENLRNCIAKSEQSGVSKTAES